MYVCDLGDFRAFIGFGRFELWPCAQASFGGIRFSEGYVGSCLDVNHITGSLVGFVVIDDAGV